MHAHLKEIGWHHLSAEDEREPRSQPSPAYEDNTACIVWGNVIGGPARAKHIDIQKQFAREDIQYGEM